ncbi:1,3-beta-glucanosyltransferase gas1 [Onygenales sp. PD_12]|nr:1,3-beta-glucanosyltransferase gas1 [Onygenales sp. PD_12]
MRLSTVLASTAVLAASMCPGPFGGLNSRHNRARSSSSYKTSGEEFFVRGLAYQEEFSGKGTGSGSGLKHKDNLADVEGCKRDVPLLKELKTNTIRVYQIDPEADHKEGMEILDDAGIYVVADLSEPVDSINRHDPEWNHDL